MVRNILLSQGVRRLRQQIKSFPCCCQINKTTTNKKNPCYSQKKIKQQLRQQRQQIKKLSQVVPVVVKKNISKAGIIRKLTDYKISALCGIVYGQSLPLSSGQTPPAAPAVRTHTKVPKSPPNQSFYICRNSKKAIQKHYFPKNLSQNLAHSAKTRYLCTRKSATNAVRLETQHNGRDRDGPFVYRLGREIFIL